MEDKDLEPQKQKPDVKNLEVLSIEALGEYIGELRDEIERVRNEIAKKKAARGDADSVFKT
jgi:uncharacterized small protein (DUF1192 family)